ncbi:HNH domain-containing protein [Madurella fahalii]|uniref:HNH domain-containing protein n=1 Tax=Madurella fahalii TaxID=1157608 RepID=A0ABQ0GIK3_9PEZI
MADKIPDEYLSNYERFRDILSSVLIEKITTPPTKPKPKRRPKKSTPPETPPTASASPSPEADADDLADFISYIATTTFLSLPLDLQTLTYRIWSDSASLQSRYTPLPLSPSAVSTILQSLDPSIPDSLVAYGITSPPTSLSGMTTAEFFTPVLSGYITALTTPPPPPRSTRSEVTGCEICGRDWINLTYHHLIPRMVHDKVVKRGWHRPEDLQNVAWLCGACHRFVHRFAGHEELAREYFTVERLLGAEAVQRFAEWVARLRWKGR